jgi:FKBP-type peptidyl-prolyl cis-trans isomerase FkpA
MFRCLLFSVLLLSVGCGGDSGDPTKVTYAKELGVDLNAMERLETGLYLQDLVIGTGDEATRGRQITADYTGWLPNGKMFDSSKPEDRNPIIFTLGQGRVIEGWEQGIPGMKVGGVRKLVIPAELGYGSQSRGEIPANSVLIFDVELLSVP